MTTSGNQVRALFDRLDALEDFDDPARRELEWELLGALVTAVEELRSKSSPSCAPET